MFIRAQEVAIEREGETVRDRSRIHFRNFPSTASSRLADC